MRPDPQLNRCLETAEDLTGLADFDWQQKPSFAGVSCKISLEPVESENWCFTKCFRETFCFTDCLLIF